MAQDRVPVFRSERSALRDVGLDQTQFHAGHGRARGRCQPHRSEARNQRQRDGCDDRRSKRWTPPSNAPQRRRRGEDRNRNEGKAVQADKRGDLRQSQVGAERHADVIPWKSGEQEPARPFAHPQSEGEREDPHGTGRPEEPGQREPKGGKDRETRWQRDNGKGQRPGELVGVDKDGRADPPEPADEIAQAHPPASAERRPEVRRKRTGPT